MSSKPKIIVFKLREIVYTMILLSLAALLVVCLIFMFTGRTKEKSSSSRTSATQETKESQQSTSEQLSTNSSLQSAYRPGVYTTPIQLGSSTVDVEVTVDSNHINSIRLVNLSETTGAAFPLFSPSLENIADQILSSQSLEGITCPQENKYTSQILFSAVSDALSRAKAAKSQ